MYGYKIIGRVQYSDTYLAFIIICNSAYDTFENLGDYLDNDIEVIGNIYDNPELLEKGGKE